MQSHQYSARAFSAGDLPRRPGNHAGFLQLRPLGSRRVCDGGVAPFLEVQASSHVRTARCNHVAGQQRVRECSTGAAKSIPLGDRTKSRRVILSTADPNHRVVAMAVAVEPETAEHKTLRSLGASTPAEALTGSAEGCPGSSAPEGGALSVSSSSDSPSQSLSDLPRFAPENAGGLLGWVERKFSPRLRGLILLNILTFLYGSNVTVVKEAQANLDPFSFSFGRFTIAAIAFAPFLKKALDCPPVRRAGIELGIWASLAYVTQSVGLITTEAGRAAFIGTFTVIEVPIIAGLFGAKIPSVTWWAAGAAVFGVGLLESQGGNSTLMGDFWTIMSALIFGFHMLRSEHHTRHIPEDGALPLISLQLAVTAVMSLAWLVGFSHLGLVPNNTLESLVNLDWAAFKHWPWLEMGYTGVLSTAFCLWVEVVSLRDVSASEAAMVYTLEPLYGAGFAWVLLGERWGPLGWLGAAFILGGSLTMQLFGRVEVVEDEPEEIEAQKSSAAILGALGAAAAIAMVMVATGGVPAFASDIGSGEMLSSTIGSAEITAWSGASEVEVNNLAQFMRAYALVKGDVAAEATGTQEEAGLTWG